MKQKITLLIIAICMATVARPQTLTSNVTLVSQKTEKIFGFENKMVVLKNKFTKVYSYKRVQPDSGQTLVDPEKNTTFLFDTIVSEEIKANFPIKEIGLAGHYDTSDYAKAFANPEEVFYSAKEDTVKVLKNYFFTKEITIKKYTISFDGKVFTLGNTESVQEEAIVLHIVLTWLLPCLMSLLLITCVLLIGMTDGYFLKTFSPSKPRKDRGPRTLFLWLSSFVLTGTSGVYFIALFTEGFEVDTHWSIRWLIVIARIIFAYYSIRLINHVFIKLAGRMEAKSQKTSLAT
ncbi:MAG: hypothetical protein KBB86_01420 [Candidatus Pacebacteria bacterium]|nr:hypothetical protein [Candidatus Paceibacterota bacterium]